MEENNQNQTETAEDAVPKKRKKGSLKDDIFDIAESTFISIFAVMLLFTYICHPVNVIGTSMVPTLNDMDKIFMNTVVRNFSYGDIIIIDNDQAYLLDENNEVVAKDSKPFNECIIKRVIAKSGQEVNIDFETGTVSVDGEVLDEPYINEITKDNDGAFKYPITVPEGYYFVMGDNRNRSADSRNPSVGFIKQEQIYGKAIIRYAPVSDFKFL